jgi:hypothetical protein
MQKLISVSCVFLFALCSSPERPGPELLERTIEYHDPERMWNSFQGHLYLSSTDTTGRKSLFELEIDNVKGYFCHITYQNGKEIVKGISGDKEFYLINGNKQISEEDRERYNLNSEAVKWVHRFYGYLYGLPMKLTDKGALVSDTVFSEQLNGKSYQTLHVTYGPGMGTEVWTFFLDPTTSAMEAYRFMFSPGSDEGEYVLLQETVNVDGIKIPKVREWYLVKGDKHLGTDNLLKAEKLTRYRIR